MKKYYLLLALAMGAGCEKHDPATDELEVETQGQDVACGKAQVVVKDPGKVAQAIGLATSASTYLALNLDTALWVRKNHTLLLRIRPATKEEKSFFCNALGVAYPSFTVVSARVK